MPSSLESLMVACFESPSIWWAWCMHLREEANRGDDLIVAINSNKGKSDMTSCNSFCACA